MMLVPAMGATEKNCFDYAAELGFVKLKSIWQVLSR